MVRFVLTVLLASSFLTMSGKTLMKDTMYPAAVSGSTLCCVAIDMLA
jgi:hypothetical protein